MGGPSWGKTAGFPHKSGGYENLKMVNGGLEGLQNVGLPKSRNIKTLEPVEVKIDKLDYEHVINTRELENSYEDYVIVDVREDKEFNGGVFYGEAKGGRLPGAIQVKFVDLFDSNGYLKPNEEIIALFENANINRTDKIVTYCTSGIRSAYSQLVLEMLGYGLTKNYDGSYNTWCVHNEVEK